MSKSLMLKRGKESKNKCFHSVRQEIFSENSGLFAEDFQEDWSQVATTFRRPTHLANAASLAVSTAVD